jgi:hypothetical protein
MTGLIDSRELKYSALGVWGCECSYTSSSPRREITGLTESLGKLDSCVTFLGALWMSGAALEAAAALKPNENAPRIVESRSLEYMLSRSPIAKLSVVMVLNRGMRSSSGVPAVAPESLLSCPCAPSLPCGWSSSSLMGAEYPGVPE